MNKLYLLPKDELCFLMKCYNEYIINFYDNQEDYVNVPVCLSEFYNNEYADEEIYKQYVTYLLEDFYYIDEEDNKIKEQFFIWRKGTDIATIKGWIDKRLKD